MEITVNYSNLGLYDEAAEALIKKVLQKGAEIRQVPDSAEISILLCGNQEIHQLNQQYRGVDAPTDVLSFPMIDYEAPADFAFLEDSPVEDYFDPDTGELLLGDIVISVEKVMEQAEKYGHSVKRELAFLVAHSMLHLFGYDHMEPDEAEVMEDKQNQILLNIGITRMEDNI